MEPGGVEREQELHAFFATERRRGEWFLPSPRLNAHIAQLGAPDRPPVNMKTRGFWNGMSSAEVMRATGISKGHLSKIRSDRRGCSPEMAIRIQEVTGLSAIRLVFGDDLCCGLGGWTEGLLAEGYRVIGYDIEEHVYGEERYPAELVVRTC
jgi:hypothetical protein